MRSAAPRSPGSLVLVMISFLALAGCSDRSTVWSGRVESPDGRWIVIANSSVYGGPGTASADTSVYLQPRRGGARLLVLEIDNGQNSAPFSGAIRIIWKDADHLDLEQEGYGAIDFQAVRCYGIDISLNAESTPGTRPGRN